MEILTMEEYGDVSKRLISTGQCQNGVKIGTWWFYNKDGSCLVGTVDSVGKLTGDNIAFVYPDMWTSLVGHFEDGVMISAKLAHLVGNNRKDPEFAFVPHLSDAIYKYDVSTDKRISSDPMLPDPYETERLVVKKSLIPEANEGLFTKTEVRAGVLLSYYNGIRLQSNEVDDRTWDDNIYSIVLSHDIVLDIPSDMTSINNYCASLGHKANHSFTPNCYTEKLNHPRFGSVIGIISKYTLPSGTEITIDYDYGVSYTGNEPDVPEWYKKQMLQFYN